MKTQPVSAILSSLALATTVCVAGEGQSTPTEAPETLGYGTHGIAEEVEDPGLGSTGTFGGEPAAPHAPGEADVSDADPRGIVDEPGDRETMGYGTPGIAEEAEDPGLGSTGTFGGKPAVPHSPGEADVSDADPRGIVDEPGERETLGYGTSGIPSDEADKESIQTAD